MMPWTVGGVPHTEHELLAEIEKRLTVNSTARVIRVLHQDGHEEAFRYVRPSPEAIVENCLAGIEGPWDQRELALAIVAGLADEDFLQ
jgi:hypothetical protein